MSRRSRGRGGGRGGATVSAEPGRGDVGRRRPRSHLATPGAGRGPSRPPPAAGTSPSPGPHAGRTGGGAW
jgi:hypothetical protein